VSVSSCDVRRKCRTLYVESKAETILTCAGWWKSLKTEAVERRASQLMGVRRDEWKMDEPFGSPPFSLPPLSP
jgi:hypothetical protein